MKSTAQVTHTQYPTATTSIVVMGPIRLTLSPNPSEVGRAKGFRWSLTAERSSPDRLHTASWGNVYRSKRAAADKVAHILLTGRF